MATRVKICCMGSVDEARTAIGAGASAIGLVSRMPSGPGPIAEELIAEIVSAMPATVDTFLLPCETAARCLPWRETAEQRVEASEWHTGRV